ncbi:SMR family transporter [Azospirillum sp. A26]|uniref:DMT family transporter n=1 Tax=Azospirillum sp. A26 TaxID=3160607 RepID=UPI00366C8279
MRLLWLGSQSSSPGRSTTAMKYSAGFTRIWTSIATVAGIAVRFSLLSWSMRTLLLGSAYMVWTGIDSVCALIAGVAMFGESASLPRLTAAKLIMGGIALMKFVGSY